MIPKIIHFCWFGNSDYPDNIKNCMETWGKILKDYQIKCWNENNFDIHCNIYVEQAYERKKLAFVSDYARLFAIYNYGGIYLDSDVRVFKSLDRFLDHGFFSGYENKSTPQYMITGTMGSVKKHPFVKACLDDYANRSFIKTDGTEDTTTNTTRATELARQIYGFVGDGNYHTFGEDIHIYPYDYFSGFRGGGVYGDKTLYDFTENTYTFHEFASSWLPKTVKSHKSIMGKCLRFMRSIRDFAKKHAHV